MSAGNRVQRIRRLALPTVLAALLLTGAVANAWAQFGISAYASGAPAIGFFD